MIFKKRKFAYNTPTFGRTKKAKEGEPYKDTVYYLWWEFLRRNEEYKKCCNQGGKGKLEKIYNDFGDVFATDFKTWWQTDDKGAMLFSEELPNSRFQLIDEVPSEQKNEKVLYLQVPLSLPKRYLIRQFHALLDKHHEGRAGVRTNLKSSAKYSVTGHVDILALQKCLQVYDMKIQNPKMKLWEIAQICKVAKPTQFIKPDDEKFPGLIANKKLVLANTASRLLVRAKKIIAGTSEGKFPVTK